MKYYPKIGLETHIELKTKSKMFCNCKNDPDERHPNINICPICLGHPGTLPVINQEAVKKTIKTGLALNCEISRHTFFERKNYFYPDLPKGYQISQYSTPLCKNGFLEIEGKKIRIRRVHLEEDTARLIHEKDCSLVDFNRAGVPLMELVTEPDIDSPREARKFAEELQLILRYLDVSDADMEKGQMRVEANISLIRTNMSTNLHKSNIRDIRDQIRENSRLLGTKVEIKNLNSFKAVEKALEYEIERQKKILESGRKVIQETRGWDPAREITFPQREKEEAQDYRYFPEPDLPPLEISQEMIDEIKAEIPELPRQKRERLKREYGLDEKAIEIFVKDKDFGEYFEKVVSEFEPNLPKEKLSRLIKLATNYLTTDLLGLLRGASVSGEDFLITPENFAEFVALIEEGKISSKIGKIVLEEMFKTGADPSHIIEEKGLTLITGEDEIEKIARQVISENQKAVSDFKKGKETALQFLVGQAMRKTKGKVNPKILNEIFRKILSP
jgi:aspartyl-tRNA(Asn)/glutamyl-tRNA(Gln) amidotransferase subunit B